MDKSAWKNILMFHGHGTENRVSKQTKHFFRPQISFPKLFSNFGGYMVWGAWLQFDLIQRRVGTAATSPARSVDLFPTFSKH